jgi:SAM-dependent methyltransferase
MAGREIEHWLSPCFNSRAVAATAFYLQGRCQQRGFVLLLNLKGFSTLERAGRPAFQNSGVRMSGDPDSASALYAVPSTVKCQAARLNYDERMIARDLPTRRRSDYHAGFNRGSIDMADIDTITGTHLDLGCGQQPRNPYGRQKLFGVDVHHGIPTRPEVTYCQANLTLNPIPFSDNTFDSVSAFDFIEHVPRQMVVDNRVTLPFLALMDEIWRVLKANGLFYAVTPAYPSPQALQDPTHVNIITNKTHEYFCGNEAYGRNYGFAGNFEPVRVEWVDTKNALTADVSFRKALRTLHRRITRGRLSHLLWELRALK